MACSRAGLVPPRVVQGCENDIDGGRKVKTFADWPWESWFVFFHWCISSHCFFFIGDYGEHIKNETLVGSHQEVTDLRKIYGRGVPKNYIYI